MAYFNCIILHHLALLIYSYAFSRMHTSIKAKSSVRLSQILQAVGINFKFYLKLHF